MNKAEWDKSHNYGNLHCCLHCKHCVWEYPKDPYAKKLKCLEKEKAGIGGRVKSNYSCDLWERIGKNE